MSTHWITNHRFKLAPALIGALWLAMISGLMIADVWDETNALVLLATEPFVSAGTLELIWWSWREPIGGFYRPLGASLVLVLGKWFEGDFVWLRYFNALLLLCSMGLLARTLVLRFQLDPQRGIAFFVLALFSASSLITATWFANIFDAACLFFLALAIRLYAANKILPCGLSFGAAVFCKEAYVLALPFFAWMLWQDWPALDRRARRSRVWLAVSMLAVSAGYWSLRHSLIPIGSEADIHGFEIDVYAASYTSFIAGFLAQSNSFSRGGAAFWMGIAALVAVVLLERNGARKLAILAILGLAGPVYWGMFGYQGEHLMSYHNFVGRLYLSPFARCLFVVFVSASRPLILLIAVISVWGVGVTWRQHSAFQQTYAEIYALAEARLGRLEVHYPEKPLADPRRGVFIGDFPNAEVRIDTRRGGIVEN